MKHSIFISLFIFIFIFIFMSGCSQTGHSDNDADAFAAEIFQHYPELSDKKYELATIKRTVDGDTFETASGHKVRLIGIDCPESHGKSEYFGKEASHFSREQLTGKTVLMFQDTGDQDQYGRLLRYVFIENQETMYNETLLSEGFANTMAIPPNVMFSEKFVELERAAREKNKGLWGVDSLSSNDSNCKEPKIKGNINSKNERIYHIPEGRYYNQTKAEEMFCTEAEASAAGYRKAK